MIKHAIAHNYWILVRALADSMPSKDKRKAKLLAMVEKHAGEERRELLDATDRVVVVLSTRYGMPTQAADGSPLTSLKNLSKNLARNIQTAMTPLEVSDLVKSHIETLSGRKVKCFNPNRDNAALQGGDTGKANGIWLRTWREMLVQAQRTGGCVLRLDLTEAGLSDMQVAETDMAADKGVPVVVLPFNLGATQESIKRALVDGDGKLLPGLLTAGSAATAPSGVQGGGEDTSGKIEQIKAEAQRATAEAKKSPWAAKYAALAEIVVNLTATSEGLREQNATLNGRLQALEGPKGGGGVGKPRVVLLPPPPADAPGGPADPNRVKPLERAKSKGSMGRLLEWASPRSAKSPRAAAITHVTPADGAAAAPARVFSGEM